MTSILSKSHLLIELISNTEAYRRYLTNRGSIRTGANKIRGVSSRIIHDVTEERLKEGYFLNHYTLEMLLSFLFQKNRQIFNIQISCKITYCKLHL